MNDSSLMVIVKKSQDREAYVIIICKATVSALRDEMVALSKTLTFHVNEQTRMMCAGRFVVSAQ